MTTPRDRGVAKFREERHLREEAHHAAVKGGIRRRIPKIGRGKCVSSRDRQIIPVSARL
jgi:hypothetical protein